MKCLVDGSVVSNGTDALGLVLVMLMTWCQLMAPSLCCCFCHACLCATAELEPWRMLYGCVHFFYFCVHNPCADRCTLRIRVRRWHWTCIDVGEACPEQKLHRAIMIKLRHPCVHLQLADQLSSSQSLPTHSFCKTRSPRRH